MRCQRCEKLAIRSQTTFRFFFLQTKAVLSPQPAAISPQQAVSEGNNKQPTTNNEQQTTNLSEAKSR
jgi:hypothetical protein